jgi:hypothetical protein
MRQMVRFADMCHQTRRIDIGVTQAKQRPFQTRLASVGNSSYGRPKNSSMRRYLTLIYI